MVQDTQAVPASSVPMLDKYLPGYSQDLYSRDQEGLLSFQTIRGVVWRQRYVILGVIALMLVAALVYTMLTKPIYQASATLRYEPSGGSIVEGQDLEPYIATNEVSRHLETLASVVMSRSLALKVVDSLDLQDNEVLLGEMITAGKPDGVSAEQWELSRRNAAAGIIRGSVSADTPYDSRIMTISVSNGDRQLAARIANAYVDSFIQQDILRGIEANSYAQEFLEERIVETRERLAEAEIDAINYARSNGIIAAPLVGGGDSSEQGGSGTAQTLTAANLAGMNQVYTQARAERVAAEQLWRSVENRPASELPQVQENANIQAMRSRLSTARGELSDLRERYQDDYPQVREMIARVTALESDIAQAEAEIKNAVRNAYEVALRQERALSSEVDFVAQQAMDEQNRRVQYSSIDRDVSTLRDQLETLLVRYNQITTASNLRTSSVTKLDEATVPSSPSSPNLMRNLLLALVVASGLAAALALLREVLDNRVRSIEEVERSLNIRALGQTPFVKSDVSDETSNSFSPIAEAYASIQSMIDFSLVKQGSKIIQITSSDVAEGKTTTSIALGRRYADIGRKVLIIDCDLRRPAVAKGADYTGKIEAGVIEVLQSPAAFEGALIKDPASNLHILPVKERPQNPVLVLSSGSIPQLLENLRSQYDVIIVDSSPVLGLADAPILSRYVDAVIMVVEAGRSPMGQTRSAIRRMQEMGANVAGVILTKYRSLESGESYDYQYRYYRYDEPA